MDAKVEIVSVPVLIPKEIKGAVDITPLSPELEEDPQTRIKAYDMFLNSMMDLDQIAVYLGVQVKSIRTWARHGNWVARKQDLMDVAMKASEQKMQEFLMKERQPTAERHLQAAKKLETAVDKTIDKVCNDDGSADPRTLKVLAEALSSSAGVSGKAVGITEMGIQGPDGAMSKKTPVVIINLAPTLSAAPNREPIDV